MRQQHGPSATAPEVSGYYWRCKLCRCTWQAVAGNYRDDVCQLCGCPDATRHYEGVSKRSVSHTRPPYY